MHCSRTQFIPDEVNKEAYWHVYNLFISYYKRYNVACDKIVELNQQQNKKTMKISKSQYQALYGFIEKKVFPKIKVWDRANRKICKDVVEDGLSFLAISEQEKKMYCTDVTFKVGHIFTCLKNAVNRKIRLEYIGTSSN